jgi:LVIVD repeat
MSMRRPRPLFVFLLAALAVLAAAALAAANHGVNADNASNMSHLANSPKAGTTNSDLAFWGNLAFAGNYGGFRILDISNPASPQVLSDFPCNGPQSDVAVYGNSERLLLFLSIDRRQVKPGTLIPEPGCSSANDPTRAIGFEGIRIIDVTDPANPEFVKGVATDCGSHTHTLVLDTKRNRVLIYVSSYPLNDHGADAEDECVAPHNKISVVEVPLARPSDARVVSQPSVGTAIGCHDIGVFLPTKPSSETKRAAPARRTAALRRVPRRARSGSTTARRPHFEGASRSGDRRPSHRSRTTSARRTTTSRSRRAAAPCSSPPSTRAGLP